jgi:hypothetical protein
MGAEVRVICCRRLVGLIVCVFAIVCGGLWRFVAVCGALRPSDSHVGVLEVTRYSGPVLTRNTAT